MLLVAYPEWRGVYSAAVAQGAVLSVHDLSVASRREALVDLLAAASGSLQLPDQPIHKPTDQLTNDCQPASETK